MHDRLKSLFAGTDSMEEQMRILSAMCEFENPDMLHHTLEYTLTDAVRSQNAHMPVVLVASNPAARTMFWALAVLPTGTTWSQRSAAEIPSLAA